MGKALDRVRDVGRVERWLERRRPRLVMLGMVTLTGGVGFLTSVGLLHLGVESMALRWGLGAVAAYAAFLLQLRLWLLVEVGLAPTFQDATRPLEHAAEAALEDPVGTYQLVRGLSAPSPRLSAEQTGRLAASLQVEAPSPPSSPGGLSLPDLELDDVPVVLVTVIVAVLAGSSLLVAGWLVWSAPTLLAELAVDATLGALLYRRIRGQPLVREPWRAAVALTWGAALVLTVLLVSGALILEAAVPGAHSLREVAARLTAPASARAQPPAGAR